MKRLPPVEKRNSGKTAYDKESSFEYDKKRFSNPQGQLFQTLEFEELRRALQDLSVPSTVLEVGCGTGRLAEIALATGHQVHAIDPSPYMLNLARRRSRPFKNSRFYLGEGAVLPFRNDVFDFVYSVRTVNQTISREYAFKMIREMLRVTKPEGILLLEFCNRWRPHFIKKSKSVRLSIADIRSVLGNKHLHPPVQVRGILIFSITILNHTPVFLLPVFKYLDRLCSSLFPQFASRCYVTIKK